MFEDVQSGCEIIPEKDFREAIRACRKDPELDRYFKFAPQAARRFIGLGFYSTHFGERADKERYEAYLAKVEPTLKEADLKYLIRFEPDKTVRAHLKDLLAHPPPPVAKKAPSLPARAAKPSGLAQASKRLSAADDETDFDAPAALITNTVLKVALAIAAAVCVISTGFNIKLGRDLAKEREERKAADAETSDLRSRLVRETRNSKHLAERLAQQTKIASPAVSSPAAQDEPEAGPEPPEPNGREAKRPEPAVVAAPGASAAIAVPPAPKQPRIRLSDGIRIVRHPDGSIDVPREFSYAGAGLRKPFWPYDQALEKSGKIESEAQRERKALEEWRTLRDEALRQAAER